MAASLKDKIKNKQAGILTYGITPPKLHTPPERLGELARLQMERIGQLPIDALILYDVQDEVDRMETERPFPYLQTVDPGVYSRDYLGGLDTARIIYRCVGNYTPEQLARVLDEQDENGAFSVFVGASSDKQQVKQTLTDAYTAFKSNTSLTFGGVVIPERHLMRYDEHLRVVNKVESGCQFFVSQAIYNVEASKDLLSDYYYYCSENGLDMVPILFNIAPCGSLKTLEFMKWLGISVPRWLERDLLHSKDILDHSLIQLRRIVEELLDFALEKNIPVGFSVESVSTRRVEIEASLQLVRDVKNSLLRRFPG